MAITFYFQDPAFKLEFYAIQFTDRAPAIVRVLSWTTTTHGILYIVLTLFLLSKHARHIRERYSNHDKIKLNMIAAVTAYSALFGLATYQTYSGLAQLDLNLLTGAIMLLSILTLSLCFVSVCTDLWPRRVSDSLLEQAVHDK